MPFAAATTAHEVQFKLLILCAIFVYAFFTFTWSLRQFGFSSVIVGATPLYKRGDISDEQREIYARHSGKVMDQASHSYNFGLRSYYYAMAMLLWFVNSLLFVVAVAVVVRILYQREFLSSTSKALLEVNQDWLKLN